jgi:CRP/FNR family transcriptional regulator
MEKRPVLRHRMLDLCAAELGEAQDRLVSVGRFNAEAKVATFLLSLLAAAARRGKAGVMLDMPMTRADIADFLGLSLETVSRVFTLFSKRGWQNEPAHHKVVLRDIPALTELADGATA